MKKRKLQNKKWTIKELERYQIRNLIAVLICLFFVGSLSIGYAALSQTLKVDGTISMNSSKEIRIIKLDNFTSTNNGYELYNASHSKDSITVNISLPHLNSTATYTMTISNNSNMDMDLKSIINETYSTQSIVYEIDGLQVNDTINSKKTITATITFRYDEKVATVPENTTLGANIKFQFEEHISTEYQFNLLTYYNKYAIVGYTGNATNLTIPSTYNGLDISTIDKYSFQNKGLTAVTLPERIETIAFQTFNNNTLTSIVFPETLKSIGNEAFFFNNLEIISFKGKTPPTISTNTFDYNFKLKTVCIPTDADKTAYKNLLDKVLYFTQYELIAGKKGACIEIGTGEPEGGDLTCGPNAYQNENTCVCHEDYEGDPYSGCSLVETLRCLSVTYQAWTKSYVITGYTCSNNNIIIPDTYEGIKITKVNKDSFRAKKIDTISLGNNIDTIDMYAFRENNLTKVTIPASVNSIVNFAFQDNQLESIIFKGTTPPTIGQSSFMNNTNLTKVCVPPGTTNAYKQKFAGVNILNTAEIYEDEGNCQ